MIQCFRSLPAPWIQCIMAIMVAEGPDPVLTELPIFPLATGLFPGAILPLHIFEERYKELMQYAIEHSGQFGLSYKDDASIGQETHPAISSVGCAAKINTVFPLEEGR